MVTAYCIRKNFIPNDINLKLIKLNFIIFKIMYQKIKYSFRIQFILKYLNLFACFFEIGKWFICYKF